MLYKVSEVVILYRIHNISTSILITIALLCGEVKYVLNLGNLHHEQSCC